MSLASLWGVTFDTEIDLPGAAAGSGPTDVIVRLGAVPASIPEVRSEGVIYQAGPDHFRLSVPGIASYLVLAGSEIVVQPDPLAHDDAVRLLLMGTPMGALLHMRERIPLHAAAVEIDGAAVLFAGHSSNGKSTMAAAFAAAGHRVVADDICAVRAGSDGTIIAEPGPVELLLWHDVLGAIGEKPDDFTSARPELEKYRFPATAVDRPLPVGRILVLGHHNQDDPEHGPIEDLVRIRVLLDQTRGSGYLEGLGAKPFHFLTTTGIAANVPMFRLTRARGRYDLEQLRADATEVIELAPETAS